MNKMELQFYKLDASRANVTAFEELMNKVPDEYKLDLKVENFFSLGIYARAVYIPKGTILTGKIHKYPQLNLLIKGTMQVLVDGEIQTVIAPFITSSPAGIKRIAHALEDCLWVTVHSTHLTDISEIEQHFIAQNEDEFQKFVEGEKQLGLPLDA